MIRYSSSEPYKSRITDITPMRVWEFWLESTADYANLPTPTVAGTITEEDDSTFETLAAPGSTAMVTDLSACYVLLSDGTWATIWEEAGASAPIG